MPLPSVWNVTVLRVDERAGAVLRGRRIDRIVSLTHGDITSGTRAAHPLRRFVILLTMVTYVVTGIVHLVHDIDVPFAPAAIATLSSASDMAKHGLGAQAAADHCHACFSVSVPAAPVTVRVATEAQDVVLGYVANPLVGRTRGLDPPPPKFLI